MTGSTHPDEQRLQRVALATDFSTCARWAVERVALLPLADRALVTLVHAPPRGALATRLRGIRGDARKALEGEARALSRCLRDAGLRGVAVETHLSAGGPVNGILETIRAQRAELVVLGKRGAGGYARLLLGSTAERVVVQAPVASLVVGMKPRRPYRRPLLAVDPAEPWQHVLAAARKLVVPGSGRWDVVHAYDVAFRGWIRMAEPSPKQLAAWRDEAKAEARRRLERDVLPGLEEIPHRLLLRQGDPRHVVPMTATRQHSDVVTLGTRARSSLGKLLLGSVAMETLRQAPCDTLVVPPG
ncbi:MAG: universal stress protein [Myxococcota bacterium]